MFSYNRNFFVGFGLISLTGLARLKIHFAGGMNIHTPDLSGKVIVITGGNTGLGFESAVKFASLKPKAIVLACTDEELSQIAAIEIK